MTSHDVAVAMPNQGYGRKDLPSSKPSGWMRPARKAVTTGLFRPLDGEDRTEAPNRTGATVHKRQTSRAMMLTGSMTMAAGSAVRWIHAST